MKKNTFDYRSYIEVVETLKSERTNPGDKIKLTIEFDGTRKPRLWLDFFVRDTELRDRYNQREEISDFVPDSYTPNPLDEMGKPLPNPTYGPTNWQEYMETEIGPRIQNCILIGGRNFDIEVTRKELGVS